MMQADRKRESQIKKSETRETILEIIGDEMNRPLLRPNYAGKGVKVC
jgi:hypothetical protein